MFFIPAAVVGISRASLNTVSVNSPSNVIIKDEKNNTPTLKNIIIKQQGRIKMSFVFIYPYIELNPLQ